MAAQNGLGSEAEKRQGASTSEDKWRASEIDVCMEAIDVAIDYKQVRYSRDLKSGHVLISDVHCLTSRLLASLDHFIYK